MKQYSTRQRQALLSYLTEHADFPLSAESICKGIGGQRKISASAVYRNLARLIADGTVRRLSGGDGKTALYRYAGGGRCDSHLHLKCERCGRILHMNDGVSDGMLQSVREAVGFSVDTRNTILYGVCDSCQ